MTFTNYLHDSSIKCSDYIFSKSKKVKTDSNKYLTQEELERNCRKLVKRSLLGLCGFRTLKATDEVVTILQNLNICDSAEQGEEMVSQLCGGKPLDYGAGALLFTKVENKAGEEKIRIQKRPYCFE